MFILQIFSRSTSKLYPYFQFWQKIKNKIRFVSEKIHNIAWSKVYLGMKNFYGLPWRFYSHIEAINLIDISRRISKCPIINGRSNWRNFMVPKITRPTPDVYRYLLWSLHLVFIFIPFHLQRCCSWSILDTTKT